MDLDLDNMFAQMDGMTTILLDQRVPRADLIFIMAPDVFSRLDIFHFKGIPIQESIYLEKGKIIIGRKKDMESEAIRRSYCPCSVCQKERLDLK